MSKRTYADAFERRFLNSVEVGGYYIKIDMFKVLSKHGQKYKIKTTENDKFVYDEGVITKRSKSATAFIREEISTKTNLIELFSTISTNDVWAAEYETYDKSDDWQKEVASTIRELSIDKAGEFIKKNFKSFGKTKRFIIGHKINPNSDNNYYTVRDLSIHFDNLNEGKTISESESKSIRKLDVNSLNFLIFNNVKYIRSKC